MKAEMKAEMKAAMEAEMNRKWTGNESGMKPERHRK